MSVGFVKILVRVVLRWMFVLVVWMMKMCLCKALVRESVMLVGMRMEMCVNNVMLIAELVRERVITVWDVILVVFILYSMKMLVMMNVLMSPLSLRMVVKLVVSAVMNLQILIQLKW